MQSRESAARQTSSPLFELRQGSQVSPEASIERIAIVSTAGSLVHGAAEAIPISAPSPLRRRRISPQAGRALEILGHAIEYLTDEYVHRGTSFSADDPEVNAIGLLMSLNRQIYFECPVVPTVGERLRSFFGLDRR
jgi:hypothetical protein